MTRTVALVGLATNTREAVQQSEAEEIWAINWMYTYDFLPRIDRLFEMHPIWLYADNDLPEYIKPRRHWEWLHRRDVRDYPVYTLKEFSDIPRCIRYPIEEVVVDLFGYHLLKGSEAKSIFTSSVDYMMALAIHEGWDVIELYGIEMGGDTEYRYQREGAMFWLGYAVSRGVTIKLQPESILARTKKYGYEGGQMIYRNDIERLKVTFQKQHRDAMARLQNLEGQLKVQREMGADQKTIDQTIVQIQDARDNALIASGAEQTCDYMLREIDLEEIEETLKHPIESITLDIHDAIHKPKS